MDRLKNAKKSLDESLNALESAVMQLQDSANRPTTAVASSDHNSSDAAGAARQTGGATAFDLHHLSQEVRAIEGDLERAIQVIAELAAQHPSGDSV